MATTSLIQVSELAAQKLSEILNEQEEDGGMLRVMVTPTPTGGFQHVLGVETEPKDDNNNNENSVNSSSDQMDFKL